MTNGNPHSYIYNVTISDITSYGEYQVREIMSTEDEETLSRQFPPTSPEAVTVKSAHQQPVRSSRTSKTVDYTVSRKLFAESNPSGIGSDNDDDDWSDSSYLPTEDESDTGKRHAGDTEGESVEAEEMFMIKTHEGNIHIR